MTSKRKLIQRFLTVVQYWASLSRVLGFGFRIQFRESRFSGRLATAIGVNAAGVAGATTPNIWPAGVVLCWRPPIFWQVFIFFPSAELLDTASRCHFHPHHITPFWDEKLINFLGRGTAPPQTPPLAAYGDSTLASSALDLRTPSVPVALTLLATAPPDSAITAITPVMAVKKFARFAYRCYHSINNVIYAVMLPTACARLTNRRIFNAVLDTCWFWHYFHYFVKK